MEKTLAWQAIAALSSLERKHLGQWLRSEFHNRKPEILRLYDHILEQMRKGESAEKDAARSYIFEEPSLKQPKKAHNNPDLQLRLALSGLLAQIESFLAYRNCFDETATVDLHAALAYRKRGLDKHFSQSIESSARKWHQQPYRHAKFFAAMADIEYERYQFLSVGRRTEPLNLQAVSDQTDLAYLSNKLQQACFTLTHQTVFKTDYDLGLLDMAIAYIQQRPQLLHTPAIGLYYYCYQFLKNQTSDEVFKTFKEQLLTHSGAFPSDEMRNLYLLALNYCIKRINQMEKPFMNEALDIYKSALHSDLLIENGYLSQFAFNNIVALSLRNQEIEWTAHFIEHYAVKLEPKHREANYRLNLARVAYATKAHDEALQHLQQADYKDLHNNLIAKILQTKIYYETQEFDALDAHLQSMQTFIRRQRIFGYHKTNYLNIVKFAKKLANLNFNNRAERIKLAEQIAAEPHLTEREWLLEQLNYRATLGT